LTLEKLIVLGARRIILFGWCGAVDSTLKIGDIIVPDKAKSGEGTSRYYCGDSAAGPDRNLCRQLKEALDGSELDAYHGCVWSTDALYREDQRMLNHLYERDHVIAVDMEFSALCAVAEHRSISFGAVLVVSDELSGDMWQPGFRAPRFLDRKKSALSTVIAFLSRSQEKK
jgi:uridine phosphorylase